ncbi:MAG: SdrD B-like domain-containing protein [Chloroflexota bacterium]
MHKQARADSFTYLDTSSSAIPDNGCQGNNVTRSFFVTDDFTVNDLNVGFIASHSFRGDIGMQVQSPSGTAVTVIQPSGNNSDNYNVLLDSNTTAPLNDGSHDNLAAAPYERTVEPSNSLNAFNGENSVGTWTVTICDNVAQDTGNVQRVELLFDGTPNIVSGQIAGNVFYDYNASGSNDGDGEGSIEGILVTAYDPSGNTFTDTTDANGQYVINGLSDGTEYRIEFTRPAALSLLEPGAAGNSTVQFITAPMGNVDVGFNYPAHYCQSNPTLATSCYVHGPQNNLADDVMVSFPYSAGCVDSDLNGVCDSGSFSSPSPTHIASGNQMGTTWGLAYQRTTDTLFVGAFMKRHTGFRQNGETGSIYKIENASNASPTVTEYVDLDALSFDTGTDPHPADNAAVLDWELDNNSWDWVGKMSLGDIDISDDEQTLWTINLFDRKLYSIPIQSAAVQAGDINTYDITNPCGNTTDFRPFAVSFHEGLVYVGITCTGESSTGGHSGGQVNSHAGDRSLLNAYVYSFDPQNSGAGFTQKLTVPLNYSRDIGLNGDVQPIDGEWNPWVNVFTTYDRDRNPGCSLDRLYPQPWLTDIEFDNGNMILGIRDRFGDQTGYEMKAPSPFVVNSAANTGCESGTSGDNSTYFNGTGIGDTLRACGDPTTGWTLESNGSCGGITTAGSNNSDGPGGGEYYYQDDYHYTNGGQFTQFHNDIGLGGIVQVPGAAGIAVTAGDPINSFNEFYNGGVLWLDNGNGTRTRSYEVYNTSSGIGAPGNGTLAKSNGLGDLEALCLLAPIEIGNRVWNDTDGDGIQDPGEAGIGGVVVTLHAPNGTQLASATTDSQGRYYFSNGQGTDSDSAKYGISGLATDTTGFELRVAVGQGLLAGLNLSPQDNDANDNADDGDLRDSDADLSGGSAVVLFDTGSAGANNHTYDFGFTAQVILVGDIEVTKNVAPGSDSSGVANWEFTITSTTPGCALPSPYDTTPALTTASGADGQTVTFSNLLVDDGGNPATACQYTITETNIPAGWQVTTSTINPQTSLTVSDGGTNQISFTNEQQFVSLGNRVWLDDGSDGGIANNGLQDGSEPGIAGVIMRLRHGDGTIFDTDPNTSGNQHYDVTTDANGYYTFTNILPGDYSVRVIGSNFNANAPLEGFSSSTDAPNTNNPDGNTDLDDNGPGTTSSGQITSGSVTLVYADEPTGEEHLGGTDNDNTTNFTVDFGFVPPTPLVALGNLIWNDLNNNGIFDSGVGETGFDGVEVQLFQGASVSGLPFMTTTTSGGFYLFDNLAEGDYVVHIPGSEFTNGRPLHNYISSDAEGGDGDSDDDVDENGQNALDNGGISSTPINLQVGVEPPGETGQGTYPGLLDDADVNMTVDFGFYRLSLGNLVFNDVYNNGTFDPGENDAGLDGVVVNLYQGTTITGSPFMTTTTGGGGFYLFDGLAEGDYVVELAQSNWDPGAVLSKFLSSLTNPITLADNAPDPDNDINNDDNGIQQVSTPRSVVSQPVTLSAHEEPTNDGDSNASSNLSVDFGLYDPDIGDLVFCDANNNGLFDTNSTDYGIADVLLNLYVDSNANGVLDAGDVLTRTTTTTTTGEYIFSFMPPNEYIVEVDPSNFGAGQVLEGAISLLGAPDPDNDVNNDDNGDPLSGFGVVALPLTLTSGGEPTDDGDNSQFTNLSVDFGFLLCSGEIPAVAVEKQLNGDNPFPVGETISFTIRITNTGNITITTLPLEDRFSSAFITYQSANPAPSTVTDSILTWTDVLSGDLDGLGISETVTVDVYFTTEADTTLMPSVDPCTQSGYAHNVAHSVGAVGGGVTVVEDGDDMDCDSVQILNPTAVELAESGLYQSPEGVSVRWTTLSEGNVIGFYIWRISGVTSQRSTPEMIVAQNAGLLKGASYQWLDAGTMLKQEELYVLEVVYDDHSTARSVIEVNGQSVYLPLLLQ